MKPLLIIGITLLSLCACTTQRTVLEEHKADGSSKISRSMTRSFWDAKSELSKLRTSHTSATQSIGIQGLDQETSSTNTLDLVERIVGAAIKAAK